MARRAGFLHTDENIDSREHRYGFTGTFEVDDDEFEPLDPTGGMMTPEQLHDVLTACEVSARTGRLAPLDEPFVYEGGSTPMVRKGDHFERAYMWGAECVSNQEYARRCKRGDDALSVSQAHCVEYRERRIRAGAAIAVAALGAAALAYYYS